MELKKLDGSFSVCKVVDYSMVNLNSTYCFIGKTDEENSLVCLQEEVPENTIEREDHWKAFRIQGILMKEEQFENAVRILAEAGYRIL